MNKQFVICSVLSVLLAGSFLGTYFRNRPSGGGSNPVVQAKALIDEAAGDQTKLAQASDLLRRELSANPGNLQAHFLEGRALQQRGLIDAALESYKKYFSEKVSTDFAANHNAAELYELKGDLPNAERNFLNCISAAPQESACWERLIRLLLKQNRNQEAKNYFNALAAQSPGNNALKNLAAIMPQQ